MSKKIVTYSDIVNRGGLPESLSSLRCVTRSGLDEFSNVVYKDQGAGKTWQQLINEYEFSIKNVTNSLSISKTNVTLIEGEKIQLTATYYTTEDIDGEYSTTELPVTDIAEWTSDNESVATVYNGLIHAIAVGSTYVRVSYEGQEAKVYVTVESKPVITTKFIYTLTCDSNTIYVGDTVQCHCQLKYYENDVLISDRDITDECSWYADPNYVGTIDDYGKFTGISEGTCNINARHYTDGPEEPISITVLEKSPETPEDVITHELLISTNEPTSIYIGETVSFEAKLITKTNGIKTNEEVVTDYCTWHSNNYDIVDINGNIATGISSGNTEIYAIYDNIYSNEISIDVTSPIVPEGEIRYVVKITAENDPYSNQVEEINMSINDVKTLYAYFYIYDKDELIETPKYIGTDGTWTTSDSEIVSGSNGGEISNGGIYSHNIEGTALVSINYLYNGITYTSDTVSVHVRDENSYSYDLSVSPDSVELEFGVHTTWQVHCIATISVTAPDGSVTTTSKDVSEDVTIVSYDSRIINVSKGKDPEGDPYILLTAVNEGETTVEFSYGESTKDIATASLNVTVLPEPVYNVNLDVSPSEVTNAYKGETLNFVIMEDAYKNNVQISGYPYNVSNVVDINIDNTDVIKLLSQGNDQVSFKCLGSSNPTSSGDSVNITFSHNGGSYGTPEPVTVPVTVYTPFISISHYEASYSYLGGTGYIGVACLTQLGFTVSKSDNWISIEDTSGNDGDQIRFSVSKNITWNSRTGYIIFKSGNVTATYTITQDALRQLDRIAVNPSSISASSTEVGNAYPITITGSFNDYSYTEVIPNNKVIINFSDNSVASYDNGKIILNNVGHTVATVSYTENNITKTATIDIQVGNITYNLIALVPETVNVGKSFTINSVRLNRLIDGKIELVPGLGNIVDDCNISWVIKDIGYVDVDNKTFHAMMPGPGTVNITYINNALGINVTCTKQFEVVNN